MYNYFADLNNDHIDLANEWELFNTVRVAAAQPAEAKPGM